MEESDKVIYKLGEVFVKSGIPNFTYIEQDATNLLRLALEQPMQRAVIVEGPPGTGKTIAAKRIIAPLPIQRFLKSEELADRQELSTLPEWHSGTVIIDNVHRLEALQSTMLVNYLGSLLNDPDEKKRLILIGTPAVHQKLLDIPYTVAQELAFSQFQKPDDTLIAQLIEKGEKALNIAFEGKDQIVSAAHGSFNLAQHLCYNLCALVPVAQTQEKTKVIPLQIDKAIRKTIDALDYSFIKAVKFFISCGDANDTICWHLLEKLRQAKDSALSLSRLKADAPSYVYSIERFVLERRIDVLHTKYPEAVNYLFFEEASQTLIVDHPQLSFYLKHKDLSALAHEMGKKLTPPQIFISYSHLDSKYMDRLVLNLNQMPLRPLIRPWIDTRIEAGQDWKEEIEKALNEAKAAILLISAPFWSSKFITKYELPILLEKAKAKSTKIIFVIISASLIDYQTEVKRFQFVNTPNNPLKDSGTEPSDWDDTFTKAARILMEHFKGEIVPT